MESKVHAAIRRYGMLRGGETVICAVSGGADSMALLWCMWLLKEKLAIRVEAAHFNHHLRGEESQRDEAFVRQFCEFHDIPLHCGGAQVIPGPKGLEAAARDARYAFLRSLDGIIATAHTAGDNAETVLMHLVRGTGLRGLGGITPKSDGLIRPMLDVTRDEVEDFLAEHWIAHVEDSSNRGDGFLRNRLRHGCMPLLRQENPSLDEALTAMAQRLRLDEELLQTLSQSIDPTDVAALRAAHPALRRRALERLLRSAGLTEPGAAYIAQAERLVFAKKPSAYAVFPGNVVLRRVYDRLSWNSGTRSIPVTCLRPGTELSLPGITVRCEGAAEPLDAPLDFTVSPVGDAVLRPRQSGDSLTLSGGTKTLKKRFIDRKIPAHLRELVPVVADESGVLGVCGFGPDRSRPQTGPLLRLVWHIHDEELKAKLTQNIKK